MGRLYKLGPRSNSLEWLRPLFSLPSGMSFNAATGTIDGHPVDVSLPWTLGTPPGTVRNVTNDAEFAAALSAAVYGDEIVVAAGTTLTGPYVLPAKSGFDANDPAKRIIIRTSDVASLPALSDSGPWVTPADVAHLFAIKVVNNASSDPPVRMAASAHGYRFIGCHFYDDKSPWTYASLTIGFEDSLFRMFADAPDQSKRTSHIIVDRCWVDGNNRSSDDKWVGVRRGVDCGADDCAVHQCYISDIGDKDHNDSQAVATSEGVSRIRITCNFLQAVTENIIMGGSSSHTDQANPTDMEIRRNHFHKKPEWDPSTENLAAGTGRGDIKNLLEIKKGVRVLIEANWFEHMYAGGQENALILESNSQNNIEPAALGQDITVRFNRWDDLSAFCNIGSRNGTNATTAANRIEVCHNLVTSYNAGHGNNVYSFQVDSLARDTVMRYNTTGGPYALMALTGATIPAGSTNWGFRLENNLYYESTVYGFRGDGGPEDEDAFNGRYLNTGNWSVKRNFAVTPSSNVMSATMKGPPNNNVELANLAAFGFVNPAALDYTLGGTSPAAGQSTDGKDCGVYMPLLTALLTGVVS